jgi:hypothetical protein
VRLRVNAPKVIHEAIAQEVVVINLDSGSYYTLTDTAADIWALLAEGVPREGLPNALLARYEGEESEVISAVDQFVDELCSDDLVVPDSGDTPVKAGARADLDGSRPLFQPPKLERFTDMQYLIALDPIHEVSEGQGWPHS